MGVGVGPDWARVSTFLRPGARDAETRKEEQDERWKREGEDRQKERNGEEEEEKIRKTLEKKRV